MSAPVPDAVRAVALIIAGASSIRAVPILLPITLLLVRLALVKALLAVEVAARHAALVRAGADLRNASLCGAAPRPRPCPRLRFRPRFQQRGCLSLPPRLTQLGARQASALVIKAYVAALRESAFAVRICVALVSALALRIAPTVRHKLALFQPPMIDFRFLFFSPSLYSSIKEWFCSLTYHFKLRPILTIHQNVDKKI